MSIYNKIVFNGQTLIDLSNDTVDSSDDIAEGLVGHLNNGTSVTGTAGGGNSGSVKFIDYDGTVLHTYSAAEFAALTAMPANPTHAGLTSQGWNWSLADAKTHIADYGMLDIGQMYITDDGKTRVYISLVDSARLSPYLGICPNGTVVVDWGDNTATDTLTGASLTTVQRAQHTYASTGNYVISLTVSSGSFAIFGTTTNASGSYLLTRTDGLIESQRCYQNAIQKVELGSNVSIGNNAFYDCYSLTSITLPSGLTSIGSYAFNNCYSLPSITIPSGVTSIAGYAFTYCYSLTSITLPSGLTSIGNNVFFDCMAFSRVTIPSGVTSIGNSAFYNCYSLTSITIPSGVTSISDSTFYDCCSLSSITLPSGLTSIGASAFYFCLSLTSITIPSGVTSIGKSAFYNCYSLTSITLPSGLTSISNSTFYLCASLTSITLPSGLTSIGAYAFYDCLSLPSITIPSGVTSIGTDAFDHCFSLSSITIPSGVTSISNSTFYDCYSLTSITLPSGLTSIGNAAFYYCYSLSSITIPSGVTSIGNSAFQNCNCVAEYHFLSTTPPTLSATAFTGILADCKIYVPSASLTAYQEATNWSTYASYMVGE